MDMDTSASYTASNMAAKLVQANPPAVTAECCRILNTLLGNLAREDCEKCEAASRVAPASPSCRAGTLSIDRRCRRRRYRRINLANAKIKAAVVAAKFATEFLLECGFEQAAEGFVEMRGDGASARAAAAQAALDAACALHGGPLALSMRLPLEGVRACCAVGENAVATGSMDNGIRIWSASPPLAGDPEPIACLREHEGIRGANRPSGAS